MINYTKQKEFFYHILNNYSLSEFEIGLDYFEDENINKIFNAILKNYDFTNDIDVSIDTIYETSGRLVDKSTIKDLIDFIPTTPRETLKHQTYAYIKDKINENDEKIYNSIITKDILESTPILSNSEYFNNIPGILKTIIDRVDDPRRKDLLFLGLITSSSIIFDNFYFYNTFQTTYPNLYTFIGAQAASGKGIIDLSNLILDKYIEKERIENDNLIAESIKNSEYTDKDGNIKYKKVEDPKIMNTIISANTSTAKFYDILNNNRNNTGLLYTTEVGEISSNKKSDWGGYDIVLRQGFHNEPISASRVNGVSVYIKKPYLSALASGTMDQYIDMFAQKTTNGLFSRCIFYLYKTDLYKWDYDYDRYNTDKKNIPFETIIKQQSVKLYEIFEYFSKYKTIEVDMIESDYHIFNTVFSKLNINNLINYDDDISSSNRRFASISKRLLMIISGFRYYETNYNEIQEKIKNYSPLFDGFDEDNEFEKLTIIATTDDVKFVLELSEKLIQHTLLLYNTLDYNIKKNKPVIVKNDIENCFEEMDDIFLVKNMKQIADEKYNIGAKTVENFIFRAIKSKKIKPTSVRGRYKKIK